jgi:hypothetical protein
MSRQPDLLLYLKLIDRLRVGALKVKDCVDLASYPVVKRELTKLVGTGCVVRRKGGLFELTVDATKAADAYRDMCLTSGERDRVLDAGMGDFLSQPNSGVVVTDKGLTSMPPLTTEVFNVLDASDYSRVTCPCCGGTILVKKV